MTGRQRGRWALLGALVLVVTACAPAAAPARPGAAAGTEWDSTVAAAKQEGALVISAPASELWRQALSTFSRDHPEIKLELTGANSRDFWPRLFEERRAGTYLWDLRVGGPDPQVYQARDEGMLDPVRSLLVLPEVVDDSKWLGGLDGIWADKGRTHLLAFLRTGSVVAYVNRDLVPESDFRSATDLLDPRWKGKIVLQDPRGGSGLGDLTVLLITQGEDFVRRLLSEQAVVVTSDTRQQAEWVARGRYPIGIGVVSHVLKLLQDSGVGQSVKPLKEGPRSASIGVGGVQLMNKAPHPNAAKVFINWLLTQQVEAEVTKIVGLNSLRLDVPPGDAEQVIDPAQASRYIAHQTEEYRPLREKAQQLAAELLK